MLKTSMNAAQTSYIFIYKSLGKYELLVFWKMQGY